MILNAMETADGQQTKGAMVQVGQDRVRGPGEDAIDAETLDKDFAGRRGWIVIEDVLAIEFGDGNAEFAGFEFGGEEVGAAEKIGAVQGKAEVDVEETSGDERQRAAGKSGFLSKTRARPD